MSFGEESGTQSPLPGQILPIKQFGVEFQPLHWRHTGSFLPPAVTI